MKCFKLMVNGVLLSARQRIPCRTACLPNALLGIYPRDIRDHVKWRAMERLKMNTAVSGAEPLVPPTLQQGGSGDAKCHP